MTQLPLDFDSERTRKVNVWLWCARLMRAEASPFEYPEKPVLNPEEREANFARAEELHAVGDRFYAKAVEVAGGQLDDDAWERAMDAFDGGA